MEWWTKGTDDEPDSDDEETSDRTVGFIPVKFEESDDMEDVLTLDPDAQYNQSTALHMIFLQKIKH